MVVVEGYPSIVVEHLSPGWLSPAKAPSPLSHGSDLHDPPEHVVPKMTDSPRGCMNIGPRAERDR